MMDKKLCLQMEILIDQELCDMATVAGTNALMELHPWMAKLKQLNIKRQSKIVCWQKLCEAVVQAAKWPNFGNGFLPGNGPNQNNSSHSNGSASSTRASSSNQTNKMYPPKLMTKECQLLFDHVGCLRCRVFYARHQ